MDPSIVKLEDEGESMHSGDDLDAFQAALIRDTEGKTHSSSQQLTTRNNGSIGDANANLHKEHILESTEMKEQQQTVLGNENQELKREDESHLQHNPLQDHCQPGHLWENPSHVPQASDLKSISNPVGNDPERPQQVNFPAPSGTIPERANARTTPKMPSVGQKKPLDAVGSSLPPSSKKQKLGEDTSDQSINRLNDVTAVSGINLREEEKQLLFPGPKKDDRVSKTSRRVVHEEEERTILQKIPLQRKLIEIMAKSGLKHIDHDVERCLSLCVEERMRGLLSNIIRMSKQRTDPEKFRNQIRITSDIRKQMNEMNPKVKEEWVRKHGGEEKNEETDVEKEANHLEQVKAQKKEEAEMRVKAANAAALVAAGGDDKFLKWKLMAEERQKSSSGLGRNSKKLSGETGGTRFGKNQGLPKVVRSISVKDVIAVLEKEPQMWRSTLLFRLYNRICKDVQTQ